MSDLVNVYALFSGYSEAVSPPDTFKDSKLLFINDESLLG